MSPARTTIKLHGIVSTGVQESAKFTEIPWVKKQFIERLGIDAYPGTFNVNVIEEDRDKLEQLKKRGGITLPPEDPGFCAARSFHVLVGKKVRGAAIIPQVTGYPAAQLEIISGERVRSALSLQDGDRVDIEVYV